MKELRKHEHGANRKAPSADEGHTVRQTASGDKGVFVKGS